MTLFGKNPDTDLIVIAEIGVNHEGDPAKAMEMLRGAARAGADAVKFQSYTPLRFVGAADPERLARVTRFALDEDTHRALAAEAETLGVAFLSTAVTEDWVPFLADLCPAMKIASGDLDFEPVIRAAAATGKPVILSTGLGTVEDIDRAVGWVRDEIGDAPLRDRLVLMHCITAYPTPVEEANVLSVPFLAERYGVHVGFSNHVIGDAACLAAVAQGAPVIEVHFTDCKTGREFRDHALSFEADDLSAFIARARDVRAALGVMGKNRQPCEVPVLEAVRKGVVAGRALEAGTVLSRDDLMFARPASGIPSGAIGTVIGRRLKAPLTEGMPLTPDNLED